MLRQHEFNHKTVRNIFIGKNFQNARSFLIFHKVVSDINQTKSDEKILANLVRNLLGFEAEKLDQKKSPFLLHLALFAHHSFKS